MSAFAASDDPDALDYSYAEPDPRTTTPPPERSMSSPEPSHGPSRSNNPLLDDDNPLVSELEQEVLDEYSRLLRNVNQVSRADRPLPAIKPSFPRRVFSTGTNYLAISTTLAF
jgi:DASH complex subunit DAD3